MPALIDHRLCDNSPYCSVSRLCPSGAARYDATKGEVNIDASRCGSCPGPCLSACPMGAVQFAPTLAELDALSGRIATGPSADELFEQKYGVKPIDPRQEGGNLIHATSDNFETEVLQSTIPVVADFWAGWCAPCKILAPTFAALAEEYSGKIKFVKVDTEEVPDVAAAYGIRSIPTILFYCNGKVVDMSVGAVPKNQLKQKLDAVLSRCQLVA